MPMSEKSEHKMGGSEGNGSRENIEVFNTLLEYLQKKVGRSPGDAIGWLYVARGCYKIKRYDWAFSALCRPEGPLNDDNPAVRKEAQHLMAFSLLRQNQVGEAHKQFCRSVGDGNDTDWQMIVELGVDKYLSTTDVARS